MYSTNDRYALMESVLSGIDGMDGDTVKAIIELHRTVYKPQFEGAAEDAADLGIGLLGPFILSFGTKFVGKRIGSAAIPVVGQILGAIWLGYDLVDLGIKWNAESNRIENEKEILEKATALVDTNLANNPNAKYAAEGANRTSEIMLKNGGTLLDKAEAVGKSARHAKKASSVETVNDDDFADKFGFTKDLHIIDASKAINHPVEFFYLMIGMDEHGKKVINKESYAEFKKQFEEYWEQNKDSFYMDEDKAKAEMLKEYIHGYYKEVFLPSYKRKLTEVVDSADKDKSVEELEAEGRNSFGDIVDKEKYYATMGFRPDGKVTDIEKFSKAFTEKTGLDLHYNPVSDKGKRLLTRMLKDPSDEYLKYLPAPVFLMTKEDQKPFIEKAQDPNRRGESQFGVYGDAVNAMDAYSAASSNAAARRGMTNGQQVGQEQSTGNSSGTPSNNSAGAQSNSSASADDITNAPDVIKTGPWPTVGREKLTEIYNLNNPRGKHLMRLGYILNIKNGKFYRMSDEDRKIMPQIVYADLDETSRKHAAERRQVKLQQGKLTRADMTADEIAESNRRAGLPEDL